MMQDILSYPKLQIELYFAIYVELKLCYKRRKIMMSIKEEEKILFDKLRETNPIVVEDGIVDEDEYKASRYKILYVMKEVNGGEGWNLKEFLKDGGRSQTWNNIARWTEGILNLENDFKWDYLESNNEDRRKIMLKKNRVNQS